ncbi:MAG: type VI secretion system contractile sheath small subunit [Acetobacteraceae bacterium]
MASESSIAPKERVNIRYKPATGDAREEIELPHKLLVVGDFTMRPDDTPLGERKRIDINKDNFSEVMRSQNLSLNVKVPNRLSDDPEAGDMSVALNISTLKDFEPDQVARAVPEIRKLLELRAALTALKGPLGNMPSFRRVIERILADEDLRKKVVDEITAASE